MGEEPEVIRQQMEETRTQLAEKLGTLESQVSEVVQTASTAVNDTAEAVQGAVGGVTEAVQSVGNVFDLRQMVERHPLLAVGGAVAAGYVAARVLGFGRTPSRPQTPAHPGLASAMASVAQASEPSGWSELRQIAFSSLNGAVRALSAWAVPRAMEILLEPQTHQGAAENPVAGADEQRGPDDGERRPTPFVSGLSSTAQARGA